MSSPSYAEVSRKYQLPLLRDDTYQDCPFCSRPNKLRTKGRYYRCFHPECNEHGDVYDYLAHFYGAQPLTRIESYILVHGETSNKAFWVKRVSLLQKAFSYYQLAVTDETLEFLNSRGYAACLEEIPFGYAPPNNWLQHSGIPLKDLIEVGLAYSSGQEFFNNRVIFPILDSKSRVVHLQGRSLDPDQDLRWLSTNNKIGNESISPICNYLFQAHEYELKESIDYLFLAEGISDTLSLLELNVPSVGCFGVQINLLKFVSLLSKVKVLLVVLDNDRYDIFRKTAGEYKSWTPMIYSLTELQEALPNLKILCCPPPAVAGVKDVNDWLKSGVTPKDLSSYVREESLPLTQFVLKHYATNWQHQSLIARLINIHQRPEDIERYRQSILGLEEDWISYLLKVIN